VVPQVGGGDLLLQLGDLGALRFDVDDRLDLGQVMVELGKCRGEVSHRPIVRPMPRCCRSPGGTVTCVAPVVAVDIGGTKIALALVSEAGDLLAEQVVATATVPDPQAVWAPLAAALARLPLHPGEPYDVGIGTAGPINTPAGT